MLSHRAESRFWANVKATSTCWLWTAGRHELGYGKFWLNGRTIGAHRVAYEIVHGPIPDGMFVCHACDVPACVRPSHLFLGSQADNIADKHTKGRHHDQRGESNNGRVKLTDDLVRDIRASASRGERGAWIARRVGVSPATVCDVVKRRTWRHI